jgi:hypothetical protein
MAKAIEIRKVPADSVPYGESICRRGHHVWAAYDGTMLLGVYATAKEARRKHSIWPQRSREHQRMMEQRRYHPGGKKP